MCVAYLQCSEAGPLDTEMPDLCPASHPLDGGEGRWALVSLRSKWATSSEGVTVWLKSGCFSMHVEGKRQNIRSPLSGNRWLVVKRGHKCLLTQCALRNPTGNLLNVS